MLLCWISFLRWNKRHMYQPDFHFYLTPSYVSIGQVLKRRTGRYVMRKPELNNSFDQKGLSYKQAGQ
ncbi:CPI_1c_G0002500.mRNA.1.CDS.1 [Saccharomyces cerevisiae]|nr:CPI_1c_G0002500.mRNA.1.CDS.1 [Saccharomyces cerevisiae]CAI7143361.1 CPI_1c_G0002500.mRNA.1.CDS.1 [Saccharomyces cerevisiae]